MIGRAIREIFRLVMLVLSLAMTSAVLQHEALADSEVRAPSDAAYPVTLEEVRKFPSVLWVDARPRRDYEAGHIPHAILLNAAEWEELASPFLDAWDPDTPVIVYCDSASCNASSQVAECLRNEMGIDNVYVLKGGWEAWKTANQ